MTLVIFLHRLRPAVCAALEVLEGVISSVFKVHLLVSVPVAATKASLPVTRKALPPPPEPTVPVKTRLYPTQNIEQPVV